MPFNVIIERKHAKFTLVGTIVENAIKPIIDIDASRQMNEQKITPTWFFLFVFNY